METSNIFDSDIFFFLSVCFFSFYWSLLSSMLSLKNTCGVPCKYTFMFDVFYLSIALVHVSCFLPTIFTSFSLVFLYFDNFKSTRRPKQPSGIP